MSVDIRPQNGFQSLFMKSRADIVIGGGAAGAGKTFSLLIEPIRFGDLKGYQAVIFRRVSTMIKGSLWFPSESLYEGFNPKPRPVPSNNEWFFGGGGRLKFTHLQYDKDAQSHQGAEYAFIGFDELTHFTSQQFWYLTSRNRTTCGIRPYMRATCNPESSGWVKRLVSKYIYPDDYHIEGLQGMPITEMRGKILYFRRVGDDLFWGESKDELIAKYPDLFNTPDILEAAKLGIGAKRFITSFSFISGSVFENMELLKVNAGYLSNLSQLAPEQKAQLLNGCWKRFEGEDIMYKYRALEGMYTNSFIKESDNSITRYITADIALEGADLFVVMVWADMVLIDISTYEKTDGKEVIDILESTAKRYGVARHNVAYDAAGVGNYINGFLKTAYNFVGGSSPLNNENYANLRTQCYFKMAEMVNTFKVYCKTKSNSEDLIKELDATRKVPYVFGRVKMESKDDIKKKIGGRSPDFADCFSMRAVFFYRKTITAKPKVLTMDKVNFTE